MNGPFGRPRPFGFAGAADIVRPSAAGVAEGAGTGRRAEEAFCVDTAVLLSSTIPERCQWPFEDFLYLLHKSIDASSLCFGLDDDVRAIKFVGDVFVGGTVCDEVFVVYCYQSLRGAGGQPFLEHALRSLKQHFVHAFPGHGRQPRLLGRRERTPQLLFDDE